MKIATFFSLLVLFTLALTACSKYDSDQIENWYDTYRDRGHIKKSDYTKAIEMAEEIMEKFTDQQESIINNSKTSTAYEEAMEDLADNFDERYDDNEDLMTILNNASEDDMGSANYRKWQRTWSKFTNRVEKLSEKAERKFD